MKQYRGPCSNVVNLVTCPRKFVLIYKYFTRYIYYLTSGFNELRQLSFSTREILNTIKNCRKTENQWTICLSRLNLCNILHADQKYKT